MTTPIKPRKITKREREILRKHYKVKNRKFRDELAKYPQYKQVAFYIPPRIGAYFPVLNPKEWLQTWSTIYIPLNQTPRNDLPATHQDTVYRYNQRVEELLNKAEVKEQIQEEQEKELQELAKEYERKREELARTLRERRNKED